MQPSKLSVLQRAPQEDLLTVEKRHNLKWYGPVSQSSDVAKTVLQATVKGGRGQGRQKKGRRQHQGMARPGVCQVPEGSREQRKMEGTGCEVIDGAPMTPTVKG